ncbi:M23 family metallopeptidase [Portibacter marinus]|uniref:M23 family metallopeptidase n=1 Tax=Portibacter marinus TaxID=2898660 RepID=UPI001F3006C9|nr:peptidoglycan DD-metalloendopeptidase family protein [Portibacter marinus]
MSDRPKIKIVRKGEAKAAEPVEEKTYPLHEEHQENHDDLSEKVPVSPEVNESQINYDDFVKPIPWLKIGVTVSVILGLIALIYFVVWPLFSNDDFESMDEMAIETNSEEAATLIKDQLPSGTEKIEDILSRDMTLRELMTEIGIPRSDVKTLEGEGNKYSIRRLRAGDKITIGHSEGAPEDVKMLIIEPKAEPYDFYLIDATALSIDKKDKKIEIRENHTAAIVEGTLGNTFIENNLNLKLISAIEEILAWSVDLFDVSDGDRFKVLYDEEFVNGKSNKIERIKALYFRKDDEDIYAFYYDEGQQGYFSELGQSMKKSFLATPIKYGGVITSGYGLRVHPVTGHAKQHLGTDFAAPEGTPIQAVADGIITKAEFKSNNGNYVKMRHDKVYETQYLHMQKFAPSLRVGSRVLQGDIIGYVGSTGLSTGPHVCYRFWKNNQQEDPRKENAGTGGRIASREIQDYYEYINPIKARLKEINYF